jgi:hypothetical protein
LHQQADDEQVSVDADSKDPQQNDSEDSADNEAAELFPGVHVKAPADSSLSGKKSKQRARRKASSNSHDAVSSDDAKSTVATVSVQPKTAVAAAVAAARPHTTTTTTAAEREEIAAFRRRLGIKIEGSDPPAPYSTFDDLPQSSESSATHARSALLTAIESGAWTEPTPIQMQALPGEAIKQCVCGVSMY